MGIHEEARWEFMNRPDGNSQTGPMGIHEQARWEFTNRPDGNS